MDQAHYVCLCVGLYVTIVTKLVVLSAVHQNTNKCHHKFQRRHFGRFDLVSTCWLTVSAHSAKNLETGVRFDPYVLINIKLEFSRHFYRIAREIYKSTIIRPGFKILNDGDDELFI